jgi:hypothetical protein
MFLIMGLLFVILIVILTKYSAYETFDPSFASKETSWDHLTSDSNTSLDCYKETPRNCMKYSNCGLCVKNNNLTCLPGDVQGPYFDEHCENWVYTNYYDRHIFGEKVTTITPAWNKFYPDYEAWYPSPISLS